MAGGPASARIARARSEFVPACKGHEQKLNGEGGWNLTDTFEFINSTIDSTLSTVDAGRRSASKSCSRLGVIKNALKVPCSLRKQVKKLNRPVFSNFDAFENTADDRHLRMRDIDFKLAKEIAENQRVVRGRDVSPRRVITELLRKRGWGNVYRHRVSSGMQISAVFCIPHRCTHITDTFNTI